MRALTHTYTPPPPPATSVLALILAGLVSHPHILNTLLYILFRSLRSLHATPSNIHIMIMYDDERMAHAPRPHKHVHSHAQTPARASVSACDGVIDVVRVGSWGVPVQRHCALSPSRPPPARGCFRIPRPHLRVLGVCVCVCVSMRCGPACMVHVRE